MKRPELLVTNGELAGRKFAVGEHGLRLGRSSSNDIHIADAGLSRNHCLFESVGDTGIRVTDLASANGTYLNGSQVGSAPVELKVGDRLEVGDTVIKVVGEEPPCVAPAAKVDLGLGNAANAAPNAPKRRSAVFNLLLVLAVLAAGAAIYLVTTMPPAETAATAVVAEPPKLKEAYYEKVEADSNSIFRFEMSLSPSGVLSVSVDDVPKEDRHLIKSTPLDGAMLEELGKILSWDAVREIDREYAGPETDPPTLSSYTLRVVYTTRARTIRITNTQEPEAFRAIRERLEAFAKNQLGVWALQYSRDKLIALAEAAIRVGKAKWDDRDVEYGNLYAAVSSFKEAMFYLDTVNPKPECFVAALRGMDEANGELERRFREQQFVVDRAITIGQWDVAKRELAVLVRMIPDREDSRNREAMAKLTDVESRMKGGK